MLQLKPTADNLGQPFWSTRLHSAQVIQLFSSWRSGRILSTNPIFLFFILLFVSHSKKNSCYVRTKQEQKQKYWICWQILPDLQDEKSWITWALWNLALENAWVKECIFCSLDNIVFEAKHSGPKVRFLFETWSHSSETDIRYWPS